MWEKTKANWFGHTLHRNCCYTHAWKVEGMVWWGSNLKNLLYIVRKALDCTVWRAHIGKGCGYSKERLHNEWMNEWMTGTETHGCNIENSPMFWKFGQLAKEAGWVWKRKTLWWTVQGQLCNVEFHVLQCAVVWQ